MKFAIYVQHLLGTGHLVRMQALADRLHQAGHDVLLVAGGRVSNDPAYRLLQLPPVKTLAGDFLTLVDESTAPVDDAFRQRRSTMLSEGVSEFAPDVLLLETWPFGRRQMAFELVPLLQRVRGLSNPPLVVSSVRDVLQHRRIKRRRETLALVAEYIDLVLVHGDDNLTPLSISYPEANQLCCEIAYTGYITRSKTPAATDAAVPRDEVLVSAGGGATGFRLLEVAAEAAQHHQADWRLLVGPNIASTEFDALRALQGRHLAVERNRSDFPALLGRCSASVSQFGYNTAVDLLLAACPAVVVPYAEDGETEQRQRAQCFAQLGLVVSLELSMLTPTSLIAAISQAEQQQCRSDQRRPPFRLEGAETSVKILEHFVAENRRGDA